MKKEKEKIIIKKEYQPPLIEILKIEMEAGFASASTFTNNQGINRRWASSEKYIEKVDRMRNK
ncbi:hypothetical protein J2O08_13470 [Elizabethkingia anophelis]|uniref:hypothetical protein n=1 Tax=Elizabethkingia anophelis TaxID=1117645 RepID=UPI0020B3B56E|nr:hypothetical protein [Elizabethkingia anophelis]MCT4216550.1 hypothetical protein [Elizabethkingia anophelis]UTF92209.1 hypothetical protein J2O08_13470 [Elizabethkingia anophelis]